MIEISDLTKRFGSKIAVNKISFNVRSGEIFGFLGPNGAGKTTTIKMIVGLMSPNEGEIEVAGVNVISDPLESKRKFSYVPDNPDIYDNMTGLQYLNFLSDIYNLSKDERKERIKRYSDEFEMTGNLNDYISGYSHGMKQKICLIGALIHEPEVFILDEPMVGLDPKSAFRLKELMRDRCNNGKSVFFSTHVMEVAEKICDRLAIIKEGKIIAMGTLDEIKEQAKDEGSLEQIFLELTE
ncbi:ABC transporter ATP-binding protein [Microaceticoccus formicicus]|uniref:ABC transporter ATP-binding protein n=1 Tax=Microaceticoccus formicicus TaxID=3118105 RepID=UPI003CD01653|nr:ABC transporter ATP-binding protein [Peptoniphilaceae bacterium AMB_02]